MAKLVILHINNITRKVVIEMCNFFDKVVKKLCNIQRKVVIKVCNTLRGKKRWSTFWMKDATKRCTVQHLGEVGGESSMCNIGGK